MEKLIKIGVGIVAINSNKDILMGLRLASYGKNTWSLPGGKLEFGESPVDGAIRALKEETNLSVTNLASHGSIVDFELSDTCLTQWITLMFSGFVCTPTALQNLEPSKHDKWAWFNPWKLPSNTWSPILKWWTSDIEGQKLRSKL